MPQYRIACGACTGEFDVEASQETKRCPSCGTEHAGPWDSPTVISEELPDALGYPVQDPRVIMAPADPRGGRA